MKTIKTTLTLLILLVFGALNTFAEDDTFELLAPSVVKISLSKGEITADDAIRYSPDSTILAVASSVGIYIYNAQTGEELDLFTGHSGAVLSVDFSPDGTTLASGSRDWTVRLWDVSTGNEIRKMRGHSNDVNSVSFSPDGTTIASGSWDETVRLWDVSTGELLQTLEGHSRIVTSVSFSPDGTTIASGSWDDTIRLWDVSTGELFQTLEGHSRDVTSVSFSPDGTTLASGSDDDTIRLWDVSTGELLQTLERRGDITCLSFSPDGTTLASAEGSNEVVRLWDVSTGALLQTLSGHDSYVNSVDFSPDGTTLASADSWDKTIWLWDVSPHSRFRVRKLSGHSDYVSSVSFSPDGSILASGSWDKTIRLWDVSTGNEIRTLEGHAIGVEAVSFSPDGTTLASAGNSWDRTVRLWDVSTGNEIRKMRGHPLNGLSVSFSPDGNMLASGSTVGAVSLLDVSTGELLQTLAGHSSNVTSVSFSPDGTTLASGGWDDTIRLWDVSTGELLQTLAGHDSYVRSVDFSPDGTTLASGSSDGTIRLWDVSTGELLQTLEGHSKSVSSVSFSPDGTTLTSGSPDRTVRLWDVRTGNEIRILSEHGVSSVSFSPDGTTLASAVADRSRSADGSWIMHNTVFLWELAPLAGDVPISPQTEVRDVPINPQVEGPNEPMRPTVSLSASSDHVASGETFTLDATLENIGGVSAATTLQFYGPAVFKRTDQEDLENAMPAIDFTDKALGEAIPIVIFITAEMGADSTHKETITITAPETDGTYAYKVCIEQIDGAGETVKTCSDVITVEVAEVAATDLHALDLQLRAVQAIPATVAPGKEFKLLATVKHFSANKSDKTTLWFYLQDEDTKSAKGLGGFQIDPLPLANGATAVRKYITVTAPETPGTYTYTASVDSVEGEENTDNNSAEITITVGVPDLAIMSMSASHTELEWNRDAPIYTTLSVTIKNIGTVKSDSTRLRVYRSANQHISEDDAVIGYPDLLEGHKVKVLNPQEEVTLEFFTKVEDKGNPDPEIADPATIYYYGALVDSSSNEVNSDNNWSKDIVRVAVTGGGAYALNVPQNFISDVAYSNGYTYFLLTAQFLKIRNPDSEVEAELDYDNKQCTIRLNLPPDNISDQPLENPAYFMFYVEVPAEELRNIAQEGAKGVFKSVIFSVIGELAGLVVKSVGGIFFASFTTGMQIGELIVDYTDRQAEAEEQTPTVNLNDPEKAQLCFLIVPGRLKNVEISVIQQFKLKGYNHISNGSYRNTWNLEETYRLENPDLAAAPDARNMSLTDFPLFQHLPPELQAYILEYFGEIANPNTLNPEAWQIPETTSLLPNYPNPFNPETWIPYQLSDPSDVRLTIYDINGRVVRDLDLGHQRAGTYHSRARAAHWDGKNAQGEPVASGVYFYTLTAGNFTSTRKMLIRK